MQVASTIRNSGIDGSIHPVLNAIALHCERDQRQLFTDLNFQLEAGDMLRICGPNGSGKTSLLRLLCGLAQPSAGHIKLFGQDLKHEREALMSSLLWIGHASGVKALFTVEENLAWLGALHK